MRFSVPITIISLLTLLTNPVFTQSANEQSSAQPKARKEQTVQTKNTDMLKLSFLVGNWKYLASSERKKDNNKAAGEGKYIARFGPGRNSLIVELHGDNSQGEDVVMDIICWNDKIAAYETITTGSSFAGMIHGKAHWEKENFVMEFSTSKNIRIIYKRIRDNELEIEEWFQSGAEPYKLATTMRVSRK